MGSPPSRVPASPLRRPLFLLALLVVLLLSTPLGLHASVPTISESYRTLLHALERARPLPADPLLRAQALIAQHPIIDAHIDLPILARMYYKNQLSQIPLGLRGGEHGVPGGMRGQVDIPRLREGGVGGFFWSVYVGCPVPAEEGNYTTASWRVRDTLEQIDIAKLLVRKYRSTFDLVRSVKAWRKSMGRGKIAGMLGVEGGHQLGSSLGVLRTYADMGVRYVTLTHTCNNALADSCGAQDQDPPIQPRWNGLSSFGLHAVREMNRLGVMVDLSHTSPKTSSDALTASIAPVIFSHSNARGVHPAVRNLPDSILRRIGRTKPSLSDGEGGKGWGYGKEEALEIAGGDAWIGVNFSPDFVSEWPNGSGRRANITFMADHADYMGRLAGREHIGIGSDFDGIPSTPEGLEDVSHYAGLIAELIRRGWSDKEIAGFNGENLLRVMEKVERVKEAMRDVEPGTEIFEGRDDLGGWQWD